MAMSHVSVPYYPQCHMSNITLFGKGTSHLIIITEVGTIRVIGEMSN